MCARALSRDMHTDCCQCATARRLRPNVPRCAGESFLSRRARTRGWTPEALFLLGPGCQCTPGR
eukprot:2959645-Rhodomonas_salina.1